MYHLTFPNISHKSRYLEMITEWKNFETPGSPWALFHGENFEEFLEYIENSVQKNHIGVPATLFFFMEDGGLLGAIQLRHHINHPNLSLDGQGWGHIGYGLRPSARGQGLSKIMLALGLKEAKKLGIEEVIVSTYEDNRPSWKTIESCGGKYIKTNKEDEKNTKIYSILT